MRNNKTYTFRLFITTSKYIQYERGLISYNVKK